MEKRMIRLKKGLDLPISGSPEQTVRGEKKPRSVALLGPDYPGMRPNFEVSVGDRVKLGQVLFTDKKMPAVRYTSPGAGKVISINRGEKRAFLSIVISLENSQEVTFSSFPGDRLSSLDRKIVESLLLESGLWTSLRARPMGKVADPANSPRSIFITAMDTNPLAPSMGAALRGRERDFLHGLTVISRLTEGKVYLCAAPGDEIPRPDSDSVEMAEFAGPHPAGNAGTHIHFLDTAGRGRDVWHMGAQDAAAVGALFTTGRLSVDRVVSMAGPSAISPSLWKTGIGAALEDLTDGELKEGSSRAISGSVLSGWTAEGPMAFLGRYHQQVTLLPEAGGRRFLGWLGPGTRLFSVKGAFLSTLLRPREYDFSTDRHGDLRAIVPVGSYEKVMPLDILPTFLLKALASGDVEEAENLGCLELVEEDLSLCSFVCPSKIDHGANLRKMLARIEKEG